MKTLIQGTCVLSALRYLLLLLFTIIKMHADVIEEWRESRMCNGCCIWTPSQEVSRDYYRDGDLFFTNSQLWIKS